MAVALLGPEDPDNFRVMENGQRWYVDPLPGCGIAPASSALYPSISKVKSAAKSDWTYIALRRVADSPPEFFHGLADAEPGVRLDMMLSKNKRGLEIDAGRGTIIHWWGEDLLHGRPMREIDDTVLAFNNLSPTSLEHANRYRDALLDFFQAYKPKLIATEYVVINRGLNGVGYGGTPDGLWWIDEPPEGYPPGLYAFDYKTRSPSSQHAAYPDEAAQIAAGAKADYMIVRADGGGAVRRPMPTIAGGMVVSIRPDGARVIPVDIDAAFEDFKERHSWYLSRAKERRGIRRIWPAKRATVN